MTPNVRPLELQIQTPATGDPAPGETLNVAVTALYNFGYAGRDQAAVARHVEELVAMGLPAPTTVPALFALPPQQATTATALVVAGHDTYGEVEYALVLTENGWLVTVASDHSDFAVEALSTARSKAVAPDVLADVAWRLEDVIETWDQLQMWCVRTDEQGETEVQRGSLADLLTPIELITILERRRGGTLELGTVILS